MEKQVPSPRFVLGHSVSSIRGSTRTANETRQYQAHFVPKFDAPFVRTPTNLSGCRDSNLGARHYSKSPGVRYCTSLVEENLARPRLRLTMKRGDKTKTPLAPRGSGLLVFISLTSVRYVERHDYCQGQNANSCFISLLMDWLELCSASSKVNPLGREDLRNPSAPRPKCACRCFKGITEATIRLDEGVLLKTTPDMIPTWATAQVGRFEMRDGMK